MESRYPNNTWSEAEPPQEGWYDCLHNGQEKRLRWWICKVNPKKRHWIDDKGSYVELDGKVFWTGTPSATHY